MVLGYTGLQVTLKVQVMKRWFQYINSYVGILPVGLVTSPLVALIQKLINAPKEMRVCLALGYEGLIVLILLCMVMFGNA